MVNLECCSYSIHITDRLNSVVKTTIMIYFANESPFEGDTRGAAHLCPRWHHTVLLAAGNDWLVVGTVWSFIYYLAAETSEGFSVPNMWTFYVVSYFLHHLVAGFQEQVFCKGQLEAYPLSWPSLESDIASLLLDSRARKMDLTSGWKECQCHSGRRACGKG